jgi:preprotein translocase subunit SecG
MTILFLILIIICCAALAFIVLIQNPKGGGLAGNVAGFGNQVMGVKQTTDVLEKGTWIFAGVIAILCIVSMAFLNKGGVSKDKNLDKVNTTGGTKTAPATTPATNTTTPATTTVPDTTKK